MNKAEVQERILRAIGFFADHSYEYYEIMVHDLMKDFIAAIRDNRVDGNTQEMASMILEVMEIG